MTRCIDTGTNRAGEVPGANGECGKMVGELLEQSLNAGWLLSGLPGGERLPFSFPADFHSVLLESGQIGEPYWRDRETQLDWIHEADWTATRSFDLPFVPEGRTFLVLDQADCEIVVRLNGAEIARLENRFIEHCVDATDTLVAGRNTLELTFLSASRVAAEKAARSEIATPYLTQNNRLAHYNYLRKPQCDAGWDWNIALSPLGIHGGIALRHCRDFRLEGTMLRQRHEDGRIELELDILTDAFHACRTVATLEAEGRRIEREVELRRGSNRTRMTLAIDEPRLWWPAGSGEQNLVEVRVAIGAAERRLAVGLRRIELIADQDAVGHRFALRVNGVTMFMRGANWVPADALPSRATRERVGDLLDSAILANMNMIRVWGGGIYEPDWFYEACTRRGLLVWQDFMFACNLYPAHDGAWLANVQREARQQVRRLSAHPCIALWCGDNELVGALGWFEESRKNRDRYLAIYSRLGHVLEEVMAEEEPDVPFWPSSPSRGRLDFGDGWHDDTSGDMHFWDVWHQSKDFEHYRSVRPRFCSEFGFQSFPSPALIGTFTEPRDRNVSSPVMAVHQRNVGGNGRIVETLARYFRFPDSFDEMCWLSQVSQAVAIRTAVEFWRSSKPRCMGTLYWQLNDTWPVASWASLEHGGAWKLCHYLARRFFEPVLVTAQPEPGTGDIVLWAVNDRPADVRLTVTGRRVSLSGAIDPVGEWWSIVPADRAVEIARIASALFGEREFLHFRWQDDDGLNKGESEYLTRRPREYDLPDPSIRTSRNGNEVTLEAGLPAFFVTWDHGGQGIWSDNCVTLLPGEPRTLRLVSPRSASAPKGSLAWLR